ncbi:MAG: hypothetical protein M1829_003969 [Trizodia sp. TS-e1964]|nr:MAG: hypothetical protein M1829_003969 [Trizodia sp. TS-e1964]
MLPHRFLFALLSLAFTGILPRCTAITPGRMVHEGAVPFYIFNHSVLGDCLGPRGEYIARSTRKPCGDFHISVLPNSMAVVRNRSFPELSEALYCVLDVNNRLDCLVQQKDFTASGMVWQDADLPQPAGLARKSDRNLWFQLKDGVQLEFRSGSELERLFATQPDTTNELFLFSDVRGSIATAAKPITAG